VIGGAVAKLAELLLLLTILFNIIVLPSCEGANPKINFNYGMTKDIIDKEPDLAGTYIFSTFKILKNPRI